jgi:hypothetical protein
MHAPVKKKNNFLALKSPQYLFQEVLKCHMENENTCRKPLMYLKTSSESRLQHVNFPGFFPWYVVTEVESAKILLLKLLNFVSVLFPDANFFTISFYAKKQWQFTPLPSFSTALKKEKKHSIKKAFSLSRRFNVSFEFRVYLTANISKVIFLETRQYSIIHKFSVRIFQVTDLKNFKYPSE